MSSNKNIIVIYYPFLDKQSFTICSYFNIKPLYAGKLTKAWSLDGATKLDCDNLEELCLMVITMEPTMANNNIIEVIISHIQ